MEKIKWAEAKFARDSSRKPQALYLRQGIALVGYGTKTFNDTDEVDVRCRTNNKQQKFARRGLL